MELIDANAIIDTLQTYRPTHVVNLTRFSTPSEAITQLGRAWDLHALDVESLGRLIISIRPECWLVHIGSGMLYGRSSLSGKLQTEGRLLAPSGQYCVTKTARDIAQGALANEGLRCLRVRPIHHTGPGQREKFVIPPFAVQIARMAEFEVQPVVDVVNSDAQRHFLDVGDVSDAYGELAADSDHLIPGSM